MTHAITFKRGPYGEILPPPFLEGINPDTELDKLLDLLGEDESPELDEATHHFYLAMAVQMAQARRLCEVLEGRWSIDPVADALCQAVMTNGEKLSLRALGTEDQTWNEFAPVFWVTRDAYYFPRWHFGLEEHGVSELLRADTASEALAKAQRRYAELANEYVAATP